MSETKLLPLGSDTRWGKVVGVQFFENERYYFILHRTGSVALMPAGVVEAEGKG